MCISLCVFKPENVRPYIVSIVANITIVTGSHDGLIGQVHIRFFSKQRRLALPTENFNCSQGHN